MPHGKGCISEAKGNWPRLNEALVNQGVLLLRHDLVDDWEYELEQMKREKTGHPLRYPGSLVRFAHGLRVNLHLPFRQLQGFLQALGRFFRILAPDYTTLWHRLCLSEIQLPELDLDETDWTIAVDSTGIKVTDWGEVVDA